MQLVCGCVMILFKRTLNQKPVREAFKKKTFFVTNVTLWGGRLERVHVTKKTIASKSFLSNFKHFQRLLFFRCIGGGQVLDQVRFRTELRCVRLTNPNFRLDGSRASFLVPSSVKDRVVQPPTTNLAAHDFNCNSLNIRMKNKGCSQKFRKFQ